MGSYKLTVGNVSNIKKGDSAKYTINSVEYKVSIVDLDYEKRIFAPGYIHTRLYLQPTTTVDQAFPGFSKLQETFSKKLVQLVYDPNDDSDSSDNSDSSDSPDNPDDPDRTYSAAC